MVKLIENFSKGLVHGLGIVFVVGIFVFGFYLVKGWNGLQATDGDTLTAAKWNEQLAKIQLLETKVELLSGSQSINECPTGFTKITNKGYTLGCIQTNQNASLANGYNAANNCYLNYGGRLPTWAERYIAVNNYELLNELDGWEWLGDLVGDAIADSTNYGRNTSAVVGGGGNNTRLTRDYMSSATLRQYRCWVEL